MMDNEIDGLFLILCIIF